MKHSNKQIGCSDVVSILRWPLALLLSVGVLLLPAAPGSAQQATGDAVSSTVSKPEPSDGEATGSAGSTAAEGLVGSVGAGQVLPRPVESVPFTAADGRLQIKALAVWPAGETLLDPVLWRLLDDLTGCVAELPPDARVCGWQLLQIERDRHTGEISVGYKADALDHDVELCIKSAANENHAASAEEAMPFGVSLAIVVSSDPEEMEKCGEGSEAAIDEWIRSLE